MTLETYYLLSLSLAATLFSVLLIMVIVLGVFSFIRISRILEKTERIIDYANQMASNINNMVQVVTGDLIATEKDIINGIRKIILVVKNIFMKKKSDVDPEAVREQT